MRVREISKMEKMIMNVCQKCGNSLHAGIMFCDACGTAVPPPAPPVCPPAPPPLNTYSPDQMPQMQNMQQPQSYNTQSGYNTQQQYNNPYGGYNPYGGNVAPPAQKKTGLITTIIVVAVIAAIFGIWRGYNNASDNAGEGGSMQARTITIYNDLGYSIRHLEISPSSEDEWSEKNYLSGAFNNATSITVNMSAGELSGNRYWDIRIDKEDEWIRLDFHNINKLYFVIEDGEVELLYE